LAQRDFLISQSKSGPSLLLAPKNKTLDQTPIFDKSPDSGPQVTNPDPSLLLVHCLELISFARAAASRRPAQAPNCGQDVHRSGWRLSLGLQRVLCGLRLLHVPCHLDFEQLKFLSQVEVLGLCFLLLSGLDRVNSLQMARRQLASPVFMRRRSVMSLVDVECVV